MAERDCPFEGTCLPTRVKLFGGGRPSLPFPHWWNYREPIRILDTYFHDVDHITGFGKHNRYLKVPWLPPVLVTRDRDVIRSILLDTGDKPGQFDRDTAPTDGIARATGEDSLLYSNGPLWRKQKKLAAPSFGKSSLFQPEKFGEFEATFRQTAARRLDLLLAQQRSTGKDVTRVSLEPEINVIMLEMLVNNFFGGSVSYDELRQRHVESLTMLIDHMVSDTIGHKLNRLFSVFKPDNKRLTQAKLDFEDLTDIALSGRADGRGMWNRFKSDATDDQLRSNIRVFLAGAMEATSSFASWAITHLARAPEFQEKIHQEVQSMDVYDPDNLQQAKSLRAALQETLRLTPSLYFLPRRATQDTRIDLGDDNYFIIPQGAHVLLDVWHANRCEDFWGREISGYPAAAFAPDRWDTLQEKGHTPRDLLHFGFGFGPRTCPGMSLGMLEVGLVVGAFIKMFEFSPVAGSVGPRAGVSTKPRDGVMLDLRVREGYRSN